jgi:SEC-C motif-containing protein
MTTAEQSLMCWCGSGRQRDVCCAPLLSGEANAPTAEALMRSRYSAFVTMNERYLRDTWYPVTCPADLHFDPDQRWLGLKVLRTEGGSADDERGVVEFVARYKIHGKGHRLHEISQFEHVAGRWLYVGGEVRPKSR